MIDKDIWELAGFQPKQNTAYNELLFNHICKYLLYGGAAYGGKSYFLRWSAVALASHYYEETGIMNIPIGLFSEDYPTLRDRQLIKIEREFPAWLGDIKESQIYGLSFMARPKYGGWIILLRNLDDPSKYSSVEFAAILVEELTKNKRATFDDLRSRMRFPGIPDPKFVGATNPGEIGHGWVKSLWIKPDMRFPDPEQERFVFISAKYGDNKFTTPAYVKQLEGITDPQKRRALMEGDWDIFEGQVFSEWRDLYHTIKRIDYPLNLCKRILCFDWGYNHPGVALWLAFTPENRFGISRCFVYRELYQNGKTPEEWASDLYEHTSLEKVDYMVLPHDCFNKTGGYQSIATVFYDKLGISIVKGRTLEKDARLNRAAITHGYLSFAADQRPYMQVHASCVNTIRTLPELVYSKTNVEDVDKAAGNDDCYDALSLGLMTAVTLGDTAGPVKPEKTKVPITSSGMPIWIPQEDGSIQAPDFWDEFKKKVAKGQRKGSGY